jgi:hypothetical protein
VRDAQRQDVGEATPRALCVATGSIPFFSLICPPGRHRPNLILCPCLLCRFGNIKFVSHSELGGRGDGVQVMVHCGFAYIGHGSNNGTTIVDVRDAKNPRVIDFIACPGGTRAIHLQSHEDLLLAVNAPSVWMMQEFQDDMAYFGGSPADKLKDQSRFTSGIRIYDISKPDKPPRDRVHAGHCLGPHRIWYTGGATPLPPFNSPISPITFRRH